MNLPARLFIKPLLGVNEAAKGRRWSNGRKQPFAKRAIELMENLKKQDEDKTRPS